MSWVTRIFRDLFAQRPTEVPLLPSGGPDEKRMAVLAKNRFDTETEDYCQRLFCLQQCTLVDMFERSVPRVIVLRCERGGFARMVLVAHRVAFLGGSIRKLEFSWNGICGWRH